VLSEKRGDFVKEQGPKEAKEIDKCIEDIEKFRDDYKN